MSCGNDLFQTVRADFPGLLLVGAVDPASQFLPHNAARLGWELRAWRSILVHVAIGADDVLGGPILRCVEPTRVSAAAAKVLMTSGLALLGLVGTSCYAGSSLRVGGRPSGKSPGAEAAGQLELGGMAKHRRRYYSLGATLDPAVYPGFSRKLSAGLKGTFELRRPRDLSNHRFRLYTAHLHAALGKEDSGPDGEISPTVDAFVGYGGGSNRFESNMFVAWSAGLIASRTSLDAHGGAWFIGVGVGLRLGFWQDQLRDEDGHQ